MVCDICKRNEAVVKVTRNSGGETTVLRLCRECYEKYDGRRVEEMPRCRNCGRTLDEIKETWIVGCEKCYERFADELDPIIRSVQKVGPNE